MRSTRQRLQDILECAQRIEKFVSQAISREDFISNSMMQAAVLYQLIIIGEAVHHIPPALIAKYPQVEWAGIDAMRNFIVHAYHRVDVGIIWTTATEEVPTLRRVVEEALEEPEDPRTDKKA